MRARYSRAVVRLRWPIVAAWILGAAACAVWLPSVGDAQSSGLGSLVPEGSEAIDAERRAADVFRFPVLTRVVAVRRDPDGLSRETVVGTVREAASLTSGRGAGAGAGVLAAFPLVNDVGHAPFVRDRGTTALTFLLFEPSLGLHAKKRRAEELVDASPGRPPFRGVTGSVPARVETIDAIAARLPLVELGTVVLVALAVGLHFRAVLAPGVTLLTIGCAYIVATHAVAALGTVIGLEVPKEVEPVVVVLLFGIITDYAIFFLSRFRRRLADGGAAGAAAEGTIADLAGIILAAGLAVMAATASLLVARLGFFRVFGPGVALAVGVGVLAAMTLLPALLAALGAAVFWPSRPGRDVPIAHAAEAPGAARRPVRSGMLDLVARRPLAATLASVAVLVAGASGLTHIRVGQTLIRGLPEDSRTRQAYEAAKAGFATGVVSPTVVLLERPAIARRRAALARVQRALERLPDVAMVVGPVQQPFSKTFGVLFGPEGDAARMVVVLGSDPLGSRAIADVRRIRQTVERSLDAQGLADVRVSLVGDTAVAAEIVGGTGEDLARVAPATLVAVGAVLALFLRALVAPLYLIAASVLALAGALGLTVYVFQDLLGHQELTYYVPFVGAVLLVALGSDYNVFLAGRVWDEARRRPIREAVAVGGARAATAITVAGLVLALSFALLALVPLRPFRELAFMMGVGLVLDAFLVRTVLVPALIALVGPASAWPGRSIAAPT